MGEFHSRFRLATEKTEEKNGKTLKIQHYMLPSSNFLQIWVNFILSLYFLEPVRQNDFEASVLSFAQFSQQPNWLYGTNSSIGQTISITSSYTQKNQISSECRLHSQIAIEPQTRAKIMPLNSLKSHSRRQKLSQLDIRYSQKQNLKTQITINFKQIQPRIIYTD